jgi:outer membrane lipoprotein SlyB
MNPGEILPAACAHPKDAAMNLLDLRKKIPLGLLALAALGPFALAVPGAQAQPSSYAVTAPRIDAFAVQPARQLSAGNELRFTLQGSPGATATLRIAGAATSFRLEETENGVYEGIYTIGRRDRITSKSLVTVNLRAGNRIATDILDDSLLAGAPTPAAARRAGSPAVAGLTRIDRFTVEPVTRLDVGTELYFSVAGTPGAAASVRIEGMEGKVVLQEASPGTYEGAYVVKSRDRITPTSTATAVLGTAPRETTLILGRSLVMAHGQAPGQGYGQGQGPRPMPVAAVCANCGVVESVNTVEVNGKGSFLGKIAGGVVGAVVGSQVGSGRGTTAAEVVGAVGGAVAGNEIEKRVKKTTHFDVAVRLQGGGAQTISYPNQPPFKVGDKVRVENGVLVAG